MKKTYTLIDQNPQQLLAILDLRRQGFSLDFIAELYNCDRTTLRYHCRKYQIFPERTIFIKNSPEVFNPKRIANEIIIKLIPKNESNWTIIGGERVNLGKSYADYLKK